MHRCRAVGRQVVPEHLQRLRRVVQPHLARGGKHPSKDVVEVRRFVQPRQLRLDPRRGRVGHGGEERGFVA